MAQFPNSPTTTAIATNKPTPKESQPKFTDKISPRSGLSPVELVNRERLEKNKNAALEAKAWER